MGDAGVVVRFYSTPSGLSGTTQLRCYRNLIPSGSLADSVRFEFIQEEYCWDAVWSFRDRWRIACVLNSLGRSIVEMRSGLFGSLEYSVRFEFTREEYCWDAVWSFRIAGV